MKTFYPVLAVLLLLSSCRKDIDIDFKRDFCENKTEILADDDLKAQFQNLDSGVVAYTPNCFTPNGDGLNDTLKMEFRYDDGTNSGAFESFKVYSKKRKLIATTDFLGWDGKNEDGKIVEGEFAYEATMKLTDDRLVTLRGHVLATSKNCVGDKYDTDCLKLPDQIHPHLGFILNTQESLSNCE